MKQYRKLNLKQIVVLIWMGISFYGVMILAEAPFWMLGLTIGSLGLSVYVARHIDWTGTEIDDEEV